MFGLYSNLLMGTLLINITYYTTNLMVFLPFLQNNGIKKPAMTAGSQSVSWLFDICGIYDKLLLSAHRGTFPQPAPPGSRLIRWRSRWIHVKLSISFVFVSASLSSCWLSSARPAPFPSSILRECGCCSSSPPSSSSGRVVRSGANAEPGCPAFAQVSSNDRFHYWLRLLVTTRSFPS